MKLRELRLTSTLHGWDPLRILAQITALQAIHYILLAAFVPPLLSIFTAPAALRFEGGPAQVGMIIDWRELASKPTWDWNVLTQWVHMYKGEGSSGRNVPTWTEAEQEAVRQWTAGSVWLHGAYVNGTNVPLVLSPSHFRWNDTLSTEARNETETATAPGTATTPGTSPTLLQQETQLEQWEWHRTHDVRRGWAISFAWLLTVVFDVQVLYYLVRKPTHVLDFVCTMHFVHFLLTSWYARSLPHSLYWWLVMVLHATLCIVCTERLAIQREMRVGFSEHQLLETAGADAMEMNERRD
ncbi:hypothetical protein MNAN1_003706 [Malassezia nana]|uniref:Integral membrane protein S linking to the trans Golgi network-domain-containing protein n=1 Tax=Malassezia nana TaxID=180528 RepID=A0AAF0EPI9_9BASI|nr:hypothetical protein MNAN1_003706 [Malassezia nana]